MEHNILELKKSLSDHELSVFNSEMEKHKKSAGLAYLLWFFLGTLGIHKFYISKIGMGIVYIVSGIVAWTSLIIGLTIGVSELLSEDFLEEAAESTSQAGLGAAMVIFIIFIIILGIMLLIDLFTIPRQIRKKYEKQELAVLQKLKSLS